MKLDEKISPELLHKTRRRIRTDFINLKRLIDPWSVPHFLFGVVTAFAVIVFSWPVLPLFYTMFGLAVLWEVFERFLRLNEAPGNSAMDVLLPVISFTATYLFVNSVNLSTEHGQALFAVSVLVYIFVNFFAWRARFYHDRDYSK